MLYDEVNSPVHFTSGKFECIDVIEDTLTPEQFEGFLLGNAMKYLHRRRHKGSKETDTKKAIWYLDRLVAHESGTKTQSID